MKTITIDDLVDEFCDDDISSEVVGIFYDIFEQVMIKHTNGLKIVE